MSIWRCRLSPGLGGHDELLGRRPRAVVAAFLVELTLLKHCICDVVDRRFDPERHEELGVVHCKNRRSALRARTAHLARPCGPVPTYTVELPQRKESRGEWVHCWQPAALETTPAQLEAELELLAMKFKPEKAQYLEGMMSLLHTVNDAGQSKQFKVRENGVWVPHRERREAFLGATP